MPVADEKSSLIPSFATIGTDNIVRSNDPPFEYPNITPAEYLVQCIQAHDQQSIAMIEPNNDNAITYDELHRRAQHFATSLLRLGIRQSDLVLFYADNSFDYALALVAVIYLGMPFCPVPPACGPFELTEQIRDANGTVLMIGSNKLSTIEKALAEPQYRKVLQSMIRVIVELDATQPDQVDAPLLAKELATKQVVTFDQLDKSSRTSDDDDDNDPDHSKEFSLQNIPHFPVKDSTTQTYLICFTSGTTGKPKGAVHTHRSVLNTLFNMSLFMKTKHQRIALWHPIGHISGTLLLPLFLSLGTSIVLFADSNIERIIQCVPQFGINILIISANQAASLVNNDYEQKYDLSSLRSIRYGGSKIAANILETIRHKYAVHMHELYGATEFFGSCMVQSDVHTWTHFEPGNCGTVTPNVEMKIVNLDNSSEALPAFEQGEICFRGPGCFQGYLNNEAATRATIDTEGWYHTGDVGYYDHRGCLFITDRIKELIKYKGYSVSPTEIEDFLYRHPAVAAVCVVGVPHVTDVNWLRAYVLLKKVDDTDDETTTEQELIEFVQDNMGTQKRLRGGVRFITEMPRTVIGKVDRKYFKRLVANELLTES